MSNWDRTSATRARNSPVEAANTSPDRFRKRSLSSAMIFSESARTSADGSDNARNKAEPIARIGVLRRIAVTDRSEARFMRVAASFMPCSERMPVKAMAPAIVDSTTTTARILVDMRRSEKRSMRLTSSDRTRDRLGWPAVSAALPLRRMSQTSIDVAVGDTSMGQSEITDDVLNER